jgi:mannose-6-phosphate isomerase class I
MNLHPNPSTLSLSKGCLSVLRPDEGHEEKDNASTSSAWTGVGADTGEELLSDSHFHLTRWQQADAFPVGAPGEARVLVCAEGHGRVTADQHETAMKRGDVVLLPAAVGAGQFRPDTSTTLFEISIPDLV